MERETPAFDLARALDLVEGDGDLLVATAQRFLAQNSSRLDQLRAALERHDTGDIERLAHGLAGACQSFAADDTERAARALMERAHSGDIPALRTVLERVEAALTDLTRALHAPRAAPRARGRGRRRHAHAARAPAHEVGSPRDVGVARRRRARDALSVRAAAPRDRRLDDAGTRRHRSVPRAARAQIRHLHL